MTDPGDHLFWITSRAAGVTALVLCSASVLAGLLMSTRTVRGTRAGDLRALHEVLSLSTMVALGGHTLSLLGDSYMHPSLPDLFIPFVSAFKTFWMALGITAAWAIVLLGLSYHARKYIGHARWRTAHRFTALAWLMGIIHAIGIGTDAGEPWFLLLNAVLIVPALALLAFRLARPRTLRTAA